MKKAISPKFSFLVLFSHSIGHSRKPNAPNNCFADCTEAKWYLLLLLFV